MPTAYLLDASALIALTLAEHEHHRHALKWSRTADLMALCPITEGALVRTLLRLGESGTTVQAILDALHRAPRWTFWPDEISYRSLDLASVQGHRQATDAYLVALAAHHGVQLVTLDRALAATYPDHTLLLP